MKGRRYRIWKLILSTAVALTMLPVQARAEGCSHTLTYSAEGNVLIETCTQNCGHSAQAKLVLDEEVPLIYTGGEIRPLKVEASKKTEATETEKALEDWLGGELTIVYENNINASTGEVKASGSIFKEIDGPENTKETIKAVMTFSIAKAENPVKVSDYAGTYDGQFHGIIMEGIPNDMVIEFSDAEDGVYSELPPTLTDVGDLTVWYKLTADNYESMSGSASISITPRELTVSAQAETVYGDAAPDMEAVYEGFAEGEDASKLTGEPVLTHAYVPFMDAGSYEIQVSAEGIHAANYTVTAKNGSLTVKPRELTVTPDATTFAYDGEAHKPAVTVAGIVNQDDIQWTVEGEAIDAGTYTAKVSISGEKSGNYSLPNNGELPFTIRQAEQAAPTGLEAVHESIWNRGDGKITGVTAEMEYKREGTEEYIPVSGTQITGLTSGTYLVRYAEKTPNYAASPDMKVTVQRGKTLKIAVPEEQNGYELIPDFGDAGWDEEMFLTFTLNPNYVMSDDFAVKINGSEIQLVDDWYYIIKNIQSDIEITVEGVEPAVTMEFFGETYHSVVDEVTFDQYTNKDQTLIIHAVSGMNIYYAEKSVKTNPAEIAEEAWTAYQEPVIIDKTDRNAVIYAKVTDGSGNVYYASTNGIIFDTTVPAILIGGEPTTAVRLNCYTTQTVTATDINLKEVRLNGVAKTLPITAEGNMDKIYLIRAEDKAGNQNQLTIYMKPIDKLDDTIADMTVYNMDPDDADKVEAVQEDAEKLYRSATVKTEKDLLKEILDKCEDLLEIKYSITTKEDNLKWTKGTKKTLIVAADGKYADFEELLIDGDVVPATNYTKKSTTTGTSITMKYTYLETLKVDKHTIQVVYDDGSTNVATLEILNSNPKTGDGSHIVLWCLTAGFSAAGLTTAALAGRKRRHRA